jgi:hypothetical protein
MRWQGPRLVVRSSEIPCLNQFLRKRSRSSLQGVTDFGCSLLSWDVAQHAAAPRLSLSSRRLLRAVSLQCVHNLACLLAPCVSPCTHPLSFLLVCLPLSPFISPLSPLYPPSPAYSPLVFMRISCKHASTASPHEWCAWSPAQFSFSGLGWLP